MAPGSRTSLVNVQPMPRIVEDDDSPPPTLPEKSYRRSHLGKYPPYTASTDSTYYPDRRDDIYNPGWKEKPWFTRRGGWCRLLLIFLLFAALAAGLGVGLTIGLRHSSGNDNSASPPSPASSPAPGSLFPAGSYSFTTALTSVSTACTSNSAAFRCYPYTIYNSASPGASAATFTWVITPVDSVQYVISSAANPFAPQFTNITLTMMDTGEPSERFIFNYTMPMQVVPASPLVAGQDATSTCWYNSTVLSATLWTRQRATYPANITAVPAPVNASSSFAAWPYAVEIREVQAPGPSVPDCLTLAGEPVGNSSTSFAAQNADNADVCGCWYSNFQVAANATSGSKGRRVEWARRREEVRESQSRLANFITTPVPVTRLATMKGGSWANNLPPKTNKPRSLPRRQSGDETVPWARGGNISRNKQANLRGTGRWSLECLAVKA